jgi:hypothetical protein
MLPKCFPDGKKYHSHHDKTIGGFGEIGSVGDGMGDVLKATLSQVFSSLICSQGNTFNPMDEAFS